MLKYAKLNKRAFSSWQILKGRNKCDITDISDETSEKLKQEVENLKEELNKKTSGMSYLFHNLMHGNILCKEVFFAHIFTAETTLLLFQFQQVSGSFILLLAQLCI